MSRKFFGTDGVRGVANEKLTPELATKLGIAAGRWLVETGQPKRAVIGRDTRQSGTMLSAALAAGLSAAGIDVVDVGVAPTPTVAFIARTGDFGLGAIVSASHNPAPDNGIKFVGHDGRKLKDEVELHMESLMEGYSDRPTGGEIGNIAHDSRDVAAYVQALLNILPERLDGMKIAMDCADGAAYDIAPLAARELGAELFLTGVTPDGTNINREGGATKPETIGRLTLARGADIGVAFDGDADRVVFCDEKGRLINGDRTMGIWAAHKQDGGKLDPAIVVGTVMSNGGFEQYLTSKGIKLERTPVGDKYVAQKIAETNALVGGEQSGHIIYPAHGPTGDGLATMMEFLQVLRQSGRKASEFYDDYEPWPQLMVNVHVKSTENWSGKLADELKEAESRLGTDGRLVVRPSGTQPVIRVMVEANNYELRDQVTDLLVGALETKLGGEVHGRVDLTYALGD
ncbi:phosphoglucosamine mutase [soil metagenome]